LLEASIFVLPLLLRLLEPGLVPLISTNPISIAFGPESTGEIIFARLGSIPLPNTFLLAIALSTGDGDVFYRRSGENVSASIIYVLQVTG